METVGRNWDAKAEECILSIFSCRERFFCLLPFSTTSKQDTFTWYHKPIMRIIQISYRLFIIKSKKKIRVYILIMWMNKVPRELTMQSPCDTFPYFSLIQHWFSWCLTERLMHFRDIVTKSILLKFSNIYTTNWKVIANLSLIKKTLKYFQN